MIFDYVLDEINVLRLNAIIKEEQKWIQFKEMLGRAFGLS